MELFPSGCTNGFLCRVKTVALWVFDAAFHDPASYEFSHQRFIDVLEVGAEAISKACTIVPYSVGLFWELWIGRATVASAFAVLSGRSESAPSVERPALARREQCSRTWPGSVSLYFRSC